MSSASRYTETVRLMQAFKKEFNLNLTVDSRDGWAFVIKNASATNNQREMHKLYGRFSSLRDLRTYYEALEAVKAGLVESLPYRHKKPRTGTVGRN